MDKKSKQQFIGFMLYVPLFLILGVPALASIVKPEDLGAFIKKASFLLIVILMLVISWWGWDFEINKKRIYGCCVMAVLVTALTVWRLSRLEGEVTMIDKAYLLAVPLWLFTQALVIIIRYIKGQRPKHSENNN